MKEEELYAFIYNPQQSGDERRRGWDLISMTADFSRMGLPNEFWELSDLNSKYEVRALPVSVSSLTLPVNTEFAVFHFSLSSALRIHQCSAFLNVPTLLR